MLKSWTLSLYMLVYTLVALHSYSRNSLNDTCRLHHWNLLGWEMTRIIYMLGLCTCLAVNHFLVQKSRRNRQWCTYKNYVMLVRWLARKYSAFQQDLNDQMWNFWLRRRLGLNQVQLTHIKRGSTACRNVQRQIKGERFHCFDAIYHEGHIGCSDTGQNWLSRPGLAGNICSSNHSQAPQNDWIAKTNNWIKFVFLVWDQFQTVIFSCGRSMSVHRIRAGGGVSCWHRFLWIYGRNLCSCHLVFTSLAWTLT